MSSRQIRVTYFLIRVPAFSLWWCQPATTITECTRKCALIEVLPQCHMFPWPRILECARGTASPFKAGSLARRTGTELQNHKRQGYGGPSRNATIDEILWLAKSKRVTIWGITGELPVPTSGSVFLRKISNLFAVSLLTWVLDRHIPRKRDQRAESVEGPFFSKGLTETECGLLRQVSL